MARSRNVVWDALELLHATPNMGWSAASRAGGDSHVAKVPGGDDEGGILALVHTRWADTAFIAALPRLLAGAVDQVGIDVTGLRGRLAGRPATAAELDVAFDGVTPGPWRVDGRAAVTGSCEGLALTGTFTLRSVPDGTLVATLDVEDIGDLAAVRLIVEGVALLDELTR